MNQYSKKTELENTYAKKSKANGDGIVYLNNTQKQRLNDIVDDDDVKNLKQLSIPSSSELSGLKSDIEANTTNIDNLEKTIDGRINGAVNINTINEQTALNSRSDNFIRLNDNVSLLADGNRLKMCTEFDRKNEPKTCYDLWTTKDLADTSAFPIQSS